MTPSNPQYVQQNGLNKSIKFGRTIYVPFQRIIVISGATVQNKVPVKDVFEFDLITRRVEKKQDITISRTSFAAHYTFGDRYIYVIGGCNDKEEMIRDCERFDLNTETWSRIPSLNQERGNPGTLLTQDKKFLYVFQGFNNQR